MTCVFGLSYRSGETVDDAEWHDLLHHTVDCCSDCGRQNLSPLGREPRQIPALPQTGLQVLPTRTIYDFEGSGIRITFLTPSSPHDLEILSRSASDIAWEVQSADGRIHAVAVYFDTPSDLLPMSSQWSGRASR